MSEHNPGEKRCADFLQDLSLYVDHEATARLCDEIERHLAECADCEVVVDTLKQTISLYHALPQLEMPERLRARLYHTFNLEEYLPKALRAQATRDLAVGSEQTRQRPLDDKTPRSRG